MIFNLTYLIITIVAVLILCKPVTNWVYNHTGFDEFIATKIENSIGDFLEEKIESQKDDTSDESNSSISESINNKINEYIIEAEENSIDNVSGFVAEKLSYVVVSAIVVIVLCIVVRIAAILLRGVLYFIANLPIIHSFDKLGGALYGLLRAFIIVYFILAVLSLLSPLIANTGITAWIKASNICSRFYNNNVFLRILG
jgi:hypothetical protein